MHRSHRKHALTLIEILVAMFLVTLVTGVIGYNVRGAFGEGRAFKTKRAMDELQSVLEMEIAYNPDVSYDNIDTEWQTVIENNLTKNKKQLLKDGWGESFIVSGDSVTATLTIESEAYNNYLRTHPGSKFGKE